MIKRLAPNLKANYPDMTITEILELVTYEVEYNFS
jgi:hypothetical protein